MELRTRNDRFLVCKEAVKRNHVLKLKRSMYGLRQSPSNFFRHLKKNLEIAGFVQSENDPGGYIKIVISMQ